MTKQEKLELFGCFDLMVKRELELIPVKWITGSGKPEDIAETWYQSKGYRVYRSKAKSGYRIIADYWYGITGKINPFDAEIVEDIRKSAGINFSPLVEAVRIKNGTPDLLLIGSNSIEFVEVKAKNEEVQPCTVRFFVQWGDLWPVTILRVINR